MRMGADSKTRAKDVAKVFMLMKISHIFCTEGSAYFEKKYHYKPAFLNNVV